MPKTTITKTAPHRHIVERGKAAVEITIDPDCLPHDVILLDQILDVLYPLGKPPRI